MSLPLPLIDLPPDQIHLWLAFDREIRDEALLERYRSELLTEEERRKEKRYYFAKHQHQYLITRALTRTILSRYADVAPADWRFDKNKHDRPLIANDHPDARSFSFNISHTPGLVVLAVSRHASLGVDVENVAEREAPLEIANRFFSPVETADLYTLPAHEQPERFFHYWTLKESYIKARSMGLAIPLDQFSFTFPGDDGIRIGFHEMIQDTPDNWRFWLFKPTEEHRLTICVNYMQQKHERIVMRKVVPFEQNSPFECPLLRGAAPSQ